MKFEKKPTTPADQSQILFSRGLVADQGVLIQRLNAVSYYRLTGYLHPFLKPGVEPKQYKDGTTLEIATVSTAAFVDSYWMP